MARVRLISGVAALTLLGACATATPYQAASGGQKGYASQQIENNRWTVNFSGNSLTDRQTVETYLLYRSAELTTQEGFDHFKVVQRETDANRRFIQSGFAASPFYCDFRFYGRSGHRLRGFPRGFYHSARFSRFGYYDPFWGDPFDVREIVRYEASAEIVMGRGPKPDDPAFFDASEVQMNLAGQIERPEA
ncbi:MAG: hypothetical protein AAGF20_05925 [Pseudomonadota bacterium]